MTDPIDVRTFTAVTGRLEPIDGDAPVAGAN